MPVDAWIARSLIVASAPIERVVGVPGDLQRLEARRERVVNQEAPGEARADAEDLLHHLGRLQRANDTGDRAEDAGLRAIGNGAGRGRLGKEAAVGRVGRAVAVAQVRLEGRDVAVERTHRPEHERALCEIAGVGDEVAGRGIVGPVRDDVVAADMLERIAGIEPRLDGLDRRRAG